MALSAGAVITIVISVTVVIIMSSWGMARTCGCLSTEDEENYIPSQPQLSYMQEVRQRNLDSMMGAAYYPSKSHQSSYGLDTTES